MSTPSLLGLSLPALEEALAPLRLKAFQVRQIYRWMYNARRLHPREMTNLSKTLRETLEKSYSWEPLLLEKTALSQDGSEKMLFRLPDGHRVETVYIPEKERKTFCLSTQVGCKFRCRFCHTGAMGFRRNLTGQEIVFQLLFALNRYSLPPTERINIVFMGMGEPLENLPALKEALPVITDPEGIAVSTRRITLSTLGIADKLEEFIRLFPAVKIALSLHFPTPEGRLLYMPAQRVHPVEESLDLLRRLKERLRHRVTFEYIKHRGVNDSLEDALALEKLTRGIPRKFNLIPFNPFPGSPLLPSSPEKVDLFAERLRKSGFVVTVRESRGQDVQASCGNLFALAEETTTLEEERPKEG